ncbi:O-acetylhomoserine aminocarboxypropyltransferase [Saliniradius amylolyticus]|uniref:O-acetylhomoserine aminocarboxypropyltransferase n=1 Tax=Saliniradius amylolyticus TaxID=2183582 RepID=A0A2S2E254_9ALTE|nr:cystathionine gamma-synthase family protein [Saliniradius amylolyticus]AWL11602.1 O-acetylhomoserine aminocarboxypropyltransferase [Saliniradius amylolyticus]
MQSKGFTTRLVHADRTLNQPQDGAVHQPTSNSVLFEYQRVEELVDVFQGRKNAHAYSRQSSGSINALQNMLAQMEEGVGALTFATGMAAITTAMLTLLKHGDHLILSQFLFGNTNSFANTLEGFGIDVTLVDVTDVTAVKEAIKPNTRAVYLETIANPVTQVADLQAIGQLCEEHGLVYMLDNTMTPAFLFDAKKARASLVLGSLTKYIAGHGHVLGGAVIDTGLYDWTRFPNINEDYKSQPEEMWGLTQIKKKGLRDMGGCLTPDSAHLISVGMETLALRMEKCCTSAMKLATYLDQHDKVETVYYPGLPSHPQHFIARELFKYYGGILSIDLKPEVDCFAFMNELQLVLNATHLGDTRTLGIPVAHTIYYEMGAEQRAKMGISDNMIRFSVGIEDTDDIIADFDQALDKV